MSIGSKFSPEINRVVDTTKIDLHHAGLWLRDYRSESKNLPDLAIDLILDYLKTERFPDPKVLQVELCDFGLFPSQEYTRKLVKRLWTELIDQQGLHHGAKYQRTSCTNASSSKVCTSNGASGSYRHYDDYYSRNSSYSGGYSSYSRSQANS